MSYPTPPNSKSAVTRAGKAIAKSEYSLQDIELVDQWRASHGYVLNTFQIWLRRTLARNNIEADFVQRLKRRKTVIDKLTRIKPDGSQLIRNVTTMHDFAGCRLIFKDIESLKKFRTALHAPTSMRNINHKCQHTLEKYDYIEDPKNTGYRGIHDVFKHYPRAHRKGDTASLPWHGLKVEIQYRTQVQHAWATALEISDIIDGKRTKFESGDDNRGQFFALESELIARHHEGLKRAYPEKSRKQIAQELSQMENELGILQRLRALGQYEGSENLKTHNVLNIIKDANGSYALKVENFRSPKLAILRANELESDPSSINAVYVRADNPTQLRRAYTNYFNDPIGFVNLIDSEI